MAKYFQELKNLYAREKFLVVSNIVVMTTTFLILGFFMSLAIGFHTALQNLEEQAQVTLFFNDDVLEEDILTLRNEILADDKVLDVTYVSKEDAFKIFTEINKDEPILLEAVSKDILPASLEIRTAQLTSLDEVAGKYETYEGVEEVKYFKDVVDSFKYWATIIYVVGGIMVLVFVSLSFAIILATLRINIASKGGEIEIMKLVGAKKDYIKAPFMFQGVMFGVVSSILASAVVLLISLSVGLFGFFGVGSTVALFANLRVPIWLFLILLVTTLICLGSLLGFIGSKVAIKRYLKY